MRVPYTEGVATHRAPESCAVAREGFGEALTGACVGGVLSREIRDSLVAHAVGTAEGETEPALSQAGTDRRGRSTSACAEAPCAGIGISHVLPRRWYQGTGREGRRP